MSNIDWQRRFARNIAVFASVIAATMAVIYCACRVGFPTNYSSVVRIFGISFLLLNVASLGHRRWFNGPAALTLLTIGAVSLTGWFLPDVAVLGWAWAVVGCLLFLYNFGRCLSDPLQRRRSLLLLFLGGLFVGLYVSGKHWGLGYNNPLAVERLAVQAGHIDAPFHASIANMIRNYGRPSTGIDGLPYLSYHYGSNWLVAALAPLCGQEVFEFYNGATGILFVPLMYASFLLFAGLLRSLAQPNDNSSLPAGFWFWAVAIAGLVGPFPKKGDMLRVSLMEIYDSDSYTLGLAVSFLVLALAVAFHFEQRAKGDNQPDIAAKLGLIAAFPLLFVVCGLIKISLGYLLVGMASYACWRLGLWRKPLYAVHLLVSGGLFVVLLKIATSRVDSHFALFNFDRVHPEWLPLFFIFYFVWVWIFGYMSFRTLHLATLGEVRAAFREGRLFTLEVLLFCTLIGLLPYLVLRFNTGSWNYFTQYQTFLGLALTLAYLDPVSEFLQQRENGWQAIPLRSIAVAVVACVIGAHLVITTTSAVYGLLKDNARLRMTLAGHPGDEWRSRIRLLYGNERGLVSDTARARLTTLATLRGLGQMPRDEKRGTVLYIPKTNRAYWGELRQSSGTEGTTPFIAPAISGLAMIAGEPEYEDLSDARRLTYGYWSYSLPSAVEDPTAAGAERAKARAKEMGFYQLIVLRETATGCCALGRIRVR